VNRSALAAVRVRAERNLYLFAALKGSDRGLAAILFLQIADEK
jgi:hypothetical protein